MENEDHKEIINFKIYKNLANFACLFFIFTVSSMTKQKVETEMEEIWYKIKDNSMRCMVKTSLSPRKGSCVQV